MDEKYARSQERMDALCNQLKQSEIGNQLVQHLSNRMAANKASLSFTHAEHAGLPQWKDRDGVTFSQISPGTAKSAFGAEYIHSYLILNHVRPDHRLIVALAHEARHCQQDWVDPYPYGSTPASCVMRGFAQEADAEAHACRAAYELAQQGLPKSWEFYRTSEWGKDIAHAFMKALPNGINVAMREAHHQWERLPERADTYRAQFLNESAKQLLVSQRTRLLPESVDINRQLADRLEKRLVEMSLPATRDNKIGQDRGPSYGL